jgi:hypothetical protein
MTLDTIKPRETPQERMGAAFDNYFSLSEVLIDDLNALLQIENGNQHWTCNFIRVSAALVEGYAHCLREMCGLSFECEAPKLAKKEAAVLQSEVEFAANDRVRLTLRAACKLFQIGPIPNFGGQEWPGVQRIFRKRHSLMHPTTPSDLAVDDKLWDEMRDDVAWLLKQFMALCYNRNTP